MKFPNPQALEDKQNSQLSQLMEEAQVKNFLLNNPDFLHNNPQLLSHLELNHQIDDATSLVERQIKVLRERNQGLQGQLIDMLHAAFNNEELLLKINQFMLKLLSQKRLSELNASIINLLKTDFELDGAALILVGNYHNAHPAQVYAAKEDIKQLLNCQFPDSQPLCGRLEKAPKKALFGDLAKDLQSVALVPLGEGCEYGLLALASNDVERFEPQMGTLFLELIAKLIAHMVRDHQIG